jgi:hypothetical protein
MRGALGVGGVTLLFQFNQEVLKVECDLELIKKSLLTQNTKTLVGDGL